jgi:hypothetical protein
VCSSDTVYPVAEKCNGLDDSCAGTLPLNEQDIDGDGFIACCPCVPPIQAALKGCCDCNPINPNIYPGAPEKCNGVDDSCHGDLTLDGKDQCVGGTPNCCPFTGTGSVCKNVTNGDAANCGGCGYSAPATSTPAGPQYICDMIRANGCGAASCTCGGAAACSGQNYCTGSGCAACTITAHCGPSCLPCGAAQVCRTDGTGCTGCNNDGDCPNTKYCSGGNCVNRSGQGGGCGADNQCLQTGAPLYCTDGVCCNEAPTTCNGCRQCNRSGSAGTCANAPINTDPHNVCVFNQAGCVRGNCNGQGSCTQLDSDNFQCVTQTCAMVAAGSYQQNVSLCRSGACTAQPAVSCGTLNCGSNACKTTCSSNADCAAAGNYCPSAGSTSCAACNVDVACGGSCVNCTASTATNRCSSGACVCGSTGGACGATSQCVGSGTSAVCKLDDGQTCGANSDCASNVCSPDGVCCGQACPADNCASGVQHVRSCAGGATCTDTQTNCATTYNSLCGATACITNCAGDADCVAGYWCKSGGGGANTCTAQIASGANCNANNCVNPANTCRMCASGNNQCGGNNKCP